MGVVAIRQVRCFSKKLNNDDKIAKKYCFRATVRIFDVEKKRPFGVFTGYDTTPDIAGIVENSCDIFKRTINPFGLECEDSEIVLHHECPCEITNEIHFARINDVDSP